MKTAKLIALVLIVALAATLMQPARAEALEPMTIITIAGAAVLVIAIIAIVVIANVRDEQRGALLDVPAVPASLAAAPAAGGPMVAGVDAGGLQGL